ncbi:MAG: hydroxyethylthiazole kinase [Dethiobacteria bacterium]|jgi:hydroxyethylthiazole kinase
MFNGADILKRIRREKPLIHHITNNVTIGDCADITMSIGALPVMAPTKEEVEEMVSSARGAVINIGTLYPAQVEAMLAMGKKARAEDIPVVLDPVGAGATSYRTETSRLIIREAKPALIKGNNAEIMSLAGVKKPRISGVQSLEEDADPLPGALGLLKTLDYGAVVAVTGPVDLLTDGRRVARVRNGHWLLPLVVGSGCMAASLVASFAAVEKDHFMAATAALVAMGVAGEIAAGGRETAGDGETVVNRETAGDEGASFLGPAEFKRRLLDALFFLTPEELDRRARVEIQ